MNKSCYDCQYLDFEHLQMYGEMICTKADIEIRRRIGQGRPDDCPLRKEEKDGKRRNNNQPC